MSVNIDRLTKSYGAVPVIPELSLNFREGAISVLLGPSGCGKTTILRCIAGLEEPSSGEIMIQNKIVYSSDKHTNLPPEKRDLGMVFQSYAIWPHMTVRENIALPLRARAASKERIDSEVTKVLDVVGLTGLAERGATNLSGGQQQRVAIARCLVSNPKLILLDEPLSNLDAKLRANMRVELRDLQERIKATMIFVTHDQEEAMSLADEIFLFNAGRLVQSGKPYELYRHPTTRYVAEFLGKANLIRTITRIHQGNIEVVDSNLNFVISTGAFPDLRGSSHLCMVRPEAWEVVRGANLGIPGKIERSVFIGDRHELLVDTSIGKQCVVTLGYDRHSVGDAVSLRVAPDRIQFMKEEVSV